GAFICLDRERAGRDLRLLDLDTGVAVVADGDRAFGRATDWYRTEVRRVGIKDKGLRLRGNPAMSWERAQASYDQSHGDIDLGAPIQPNDLPLRHWVA